MSTEAYTKEGAVVTESMLREIAACGYNDICFHVEWGEQTEKIRAIHKGLVQAGLKEVIEELGLTTSIWVREFVDWDASWGKPTADNDRLFGAMRKRYEGYFDLWPEIDYFVITNTETQMTPRGKATFERIFNVIGQVAREHNANIIVRSFFHGPREVWLNDMLPSIPEHAWVQHKYVQGDWSMRRPNNPLIAMKQHHPLIAEFDIGGEYYKTDYILRCHVDDLAERMKYVGDSGVQGISVRLNRFGGTVFEHPNAVNYWYLGLLTSGQVESSEEAWQRFAVEYFGKDVADEMIEILRPTGAATAEALSIGRNAYGNARNSSIAATRHDRQHRRFEHPLFLEAHKSFAEDTERYVRAKTRMEEILRGEPKWIEQEREAYSAHLGALKRSKQKLEGLKARLDASTYKYTHWLMEETIWFLKVMEEAQLAHLKVFRIRHGGDQVKREQLLQEVCEHLETIEKLALVDESVQGQWRGRKYGLRRGSHTDAAQFVTEFRLWMHELGLRGPLQFDKDADGRKEDVTTLDELVAYHVSRGWKERAAERYVYWIRRKDMDFQKWIGHLFGGIEQ
jgi:hypothetical protein